MQNVASALKVEISRLARKELRSETASLKKAVATYRHEIAALKRKVAQLEKQVKRAPRKTPVQSVNGAAVSDEKLRFRAQGFAQHRGRLGLSAREMGLLLDASPLSVYKWETGKAKPRAKHLQAIAAIRKMGKREAAQRLEQLAAKG